MQRLQSFTIVPQALHISRIIEQGNTIRHHSSHSSLARSIDLREVEDSSSLLDAEDGYASYAFQIC